ncbi:hypothetical protein RI444_15380 [Paenarthrobacter sp. AT5]|uniref:hypothetical protein n=1 Tax=Paenarthrobacter TaxID=1742992 RepID=UPI001A98C6C8|nr:MULTISPECIES: hypothetical protein [Paenarthrobacter]QSZ53285.1 hypothetical protein AYX19_09890 [Paenarthrobacter ureafaciens]WOC59889.1 hypothetical protein RI444_15380 [Paenarthrobacter sp. AT5]
MHDRQAFREAREDGESIRSISRGHGASRNAVRRALRPGARYNYYRPSASEDAEPAVRDVLADYPQMSVADIALLIDWRKSRRQLSDLVARLRPQAASEWPSIQARPLHSITIGHLSTKPLDIGKMEIGELNL